MRLKLSLIVILLVPIGLFGVVWGNGSECAFGECNRFNPNGGVIKALVVEGAERSLKSYSEYQLFLQKFELSELYEPNIDEMRDILNKAIKSMEEAKDAYDELKTIAKTIPYDYTFIAKLQAFDYDSFPEGKDLNLQVFNEVKNYLSNGDVNGLYERFFTNAQEIMAGLQAIKHQMNRKALPDIVEVWKASQIFSNSSLFGMYSAMVFRSI